MDGLFALSLDRLKWLSARQMKVVDNIANLNTPNFKARDVSPFADTVASLKRFRDGSHNSTFLLSERPAIDTIALKAGYQSLSGNTVNLEDELSKLSDNAKSYALATNITRTYQRLFLGSLKGSF
jgi:flagellar basal-body rod protein FlgB